MSNPAELYTAAMANTAKIVRGVSSDSWGRPTPCTEWSVRDVVNHLTNENLWAVELLAGRTIEEVGDSLDGDLLGDEPLEAYDESVDKARGAANAPGTLEAVCHLSFGDYPGSVYLSQVFLDTLIHVWDIAAGSGQDRTMPDEIVQACFPLAQQAREDFGEYGVIGENLDDPGADTQSRVLGLLGRRTDWVPPAE